MLGLVQDFVWQKAAQSVAEKVTQARAPQLLPWHKPGREGHQRAVEHRKARLDARELAGPRYLGQVIVVQGVAEIEREHAIDQRIGLHAGIHLGHLRRGLYGVDRSEELG